jgi:hypothetical protein
MLTKIRQGRCSRLIAIPALLVMIGGLNSCRSRDSDLAAGDVAGRASDRGKGSFEYWSYDEGPLRTPMGEELIKLHRNIPYFPGLSTAIYGEQFFRPAFGPIAWRMMQKPNSVKILFIGQDGTHIAEAAGRPATAGFGGRAQDLAEYFGVSSSAAFINTYAFTIKWQYGVFDAPVISGPSNDAKTLQFSSFTPNQVWLLTQDQQSRIAQWRNDMIDWIIRNNRESLKMIVLFGGAARDAMGSFVISRGGSVGSRYSAEEIKKNQIQVAEFKLVPAGGNKQASLMLNTSGEAMYTTETAEQFKQEFVANSAQYIKKVALPKGGIEGSGMIDAAQLGGYDIARKMRVNGQQTISLKGLKLSDGKRVGILDDGQEFDVLVTQLPHPTALSMMKPAEASTAVKKGLQAFSKYPNWTIPADKYFENQFAKDQEFKYGRGDMGPEYYDFGAPNSRMVNVSSASRLKADTIVFGTRDRVRFNTTRLDNMRGAPRPFPAPDSKQMWISKSFSADLYEFDPGPPIEVAKMIKQSLPKDSEFKSKMSTNGDYAHYRGTWNDPQVLVIADPHGVDDLITARALTGTRGQHLHNFISNLSFGTSSKKVLDQYLVLKTVPYGSQDSMSDQDWQEAVRMTAEYRQEVIKQTLARVSPKLIILDGPIAAEEFAQIDPSLAKKALVVLRSPPDAKDQQKSIIADLNQAKDLLKGAKTSYDGKMHSIPRSHLSYYARTWEGTSGDRVISADGAAQGIAFAEVAPKWAYTQKYTLKGDDLKSCKALYTKLAKANLRLNFKESIPAYYDRIERGTPVADSCAGEIASDNDESPGPNGTVLDWADDGHSMVRLQLPIPQPPQQHNPDSLEGPELKLLFADPQVR